MAKELEMRVLEADGDHSLVKAVAIIAVMRTDKGVTLNIRENGDLTEDWWAAFPKAMQDTIDQMLEARRKVLK